MVGLKSQIVIGRKGSQAQRTGSQAHQQSPPPHRCLLFLSSYYRISWGLLGKAWSIQDPGWQSQAAGGIAITSVCFLSKVEECERYRLESWQVQPGLCYRATSSPQSRSHQAGAVRSTEDVNATLQG